MISYDLSKAEYVDSSKNQDADRPAAATPMLPSTRPAILPTNREARKAVPLSRGLLDYFPDALCAVAEVSRVGSEQHHPDSGVWWERSKSDDHPDCLLRHFMERGTLDDDNCRHTAKVAWRALAMLQLEIESERNAGQTAPKSKPKG